MRNPPPSQSTPNTWIGHKDLGKAQFERGEYLEALASYRAALNPEYGIPTSERQVILSNVVACRLKLGGVVQAEAAVEEAKQCIALNPSWAKAHIRLASAYIELGGHSNDACNELQRALALDPGNPTARQMLMRELRRDRHHPVPSAPPEEDDEDSVRSPATSYRASSDNMASSGGTATAPPDYDGVDDPLRENTVDESFTLSDRIKFGISRAVAWYDGQPEDIKTFLRVLVVIIVLYVAFGGRFGMDYFFGKNNHENRGNYERGNAYDRFHGRTNSHYGSNSEQRRNVYGDYQDGYEYQYRPRRRNTRPSFGFSHLFDGSFTSILFIGGIVYICHKNNINPFTALVVINAVGGNRGRGMRHMGLAGLGYGAVRGAYGRRRRQNGWY